MSADQEHFQLPFFYSLMRPVSVASFCCDLELLRHRINKRNSFYMDPHPQKDSFIGAARSPSVALSQPDEWWLNLTL